jgi:hypothetical protein
MTTMPLASLTLCALSAVAGLVAVPHVGAPLLGQDQAAKFDLART